MVLEKKPFVSYTLEEDRDKDSKIFTIRLNKEEIINLKEAQIMLQQEKQSTAIKQLAMLGLFVLHERSTAHILKVLEDNIRKNKRIGIEKVNIK